MAKGRGGDGILVASMTTATQLAAHGYDLASCGFAAAADRNVYQFLAAPLARAVIETLDDPSASILDVAAGTGAVGRHFPTVIALDVTGEQLRRNQARCRVEADGQRLPFRDSSFGAAVCGFGINHVTDPMVLLTEMARVAPVVGVSTWLRPEVAYRPKQVVFAALARRCGRVRSALGELLDRYGDAVGSVDAVTHLLVSSGLESQVRAVQVEIPWPGVDAYLDYRLSMPTSSSAQDHALRNELRQELLGLSAEDLVWRPRIIVGIGRV